MADTSRFPSLVLPFAITGAAAGWLSAGLGGRPFSQTLVALTATVVAALTGAILTRLCVGRRYQYELDPPDPELRPATDNGLLHTAIVLGAGAATGGLLSLTDPRCCTRLDCMLGGAAFTIVFVPVCLAVVAAARRAQRARLGSLVASCDRRAVWGILAITLGVTTVEALPEWPEWSSGSGAMPIVALALAALTGAVTLVVRHRDAGALKQARGEIEAGLLAQGHEDPEPEEGAVARLDLGLGDEMLARIAHGAAAYRDRQRTVALVRGNPELSLFALRRAVGRGTIGLLVLGAVVAAHLVGAVVPAIVIYELRCSSTGERSACTLARELKRHR
jgi:hypothetical protein